MTDIKETRNQVSVTPPQKRNPTGKGGFGDNPDNRSSGRWNKEESISYQYNRIGRMSDEELKTFKPQTQFQKIALARVKAARDEKFGLQDAKEITDRTEGKAPQSVDVTTNGESINPYNGLTEAELKKLAGK